MLDLDPATGRDPVDDWQAIERELGEYSADLAARPQVLAANKVDLDGAAPRLARVRELAEGHGLPLVAISARTGAGLEGLRAALGRLLTPPAAEPARRRRRDDAGPAPGPPAGGQGRERSRRRGRGRAGRDADRPPGGQAVRVAVPPLKVALVSSGAIASGTVRLGLKERPRRSPRSRRRPPSARWPSCGTTNRRSPPTAVGWPRSS